MSGLLELARTKLFYYLCRKYVQRADARQKELGLQYTEAETHDLAECVARWFINEGWEPSGPLNQEIERLRTVIGAARALAGALVPSSPSAIGLHRRLLEITDPEYKGP